MNQFNRRGLLVITGAAAAAGLLRGGVAGATEGPSSYTPTWPSVDQHPSVWPYHNFIHGARDKAGNWVQFAPKLKSAGGNFDPDGWAQLFVDAGAKFAGPVAEHHDGYSMWNSTVNEWNSVFDYERGGPAGTRNPYWLTDDSISSTSWCYTVGIGYYSLAAMVHSLIDRVSKNGNVLLMADGTIPSGQRTLLLGIGDYLERFGESVYATRAWTAFGEGPTRMGGGSFVEPRAGTNQDIRFTRSKDNTVLYATVMGSRLKQWSWDGNNNLQWRLNAVGNGRYQIINRGTGTALDSLGDATAGSSTAMWAPNNSPNNHWTITSV